MTTAAQRTVYCDQGTQEWFESRIGCIGASRIADAIAKPKRVQKTKEGEPVKPVAELECRHKMKLEILLERLTGKTAEHYVSYWMQQGTEREPLARVEYEMRFSVSVDQVGFVYHPTIKWAGASPDGLIGSDGILEIKCPKPETHLGYIVADQIPSEYLPQLLWQLACCDDRKWNDFISFCPELPEKYQIFHKRLDRTDEVQAVIRGMELEAKQFLLEVEQLREQLDGKYL